MSSGVPVSLVGECVWVGVRVGGWCEHVCMHVCVHVCYYIITVSVLASCLYVCRSDLALFGVSKLVHRYKGTPYLIQVHLQHLVSVCVEYS